MRVKLLLAALPLLPLGAVWGAAAPPSNQHVSQLDPGVAAETVRAANRRAVESLFEQVSARPITSKITVGALVRELGVKDEFRRVFFRADQIGGPRWVDDATVQVQLEVSTDRIVANLKQLVAAHRERSPVTGEQVEAAAQDWPRVFASTGSSAASKALFDFKPPVSDRWARVSDAARQQALAAADQDARRRVLESVGPVSLTTQSTIADGLADPQVGQRVRQWLSDRPVTRVDFRDNLQVEVALAVDEHDLFDVVRTALDQQKGVAIPRSPEDWRRVERDFGSRFIPAVGQATAQAEATTTRVSPQPDLPQRPPAWVDQQVGIEASAAPASGVNKKLMTALAAERDARSKLRERIESLPFDQQMTVGEAARRDPRVARAVQTTVKRAQVYKTIYNGDGTATVRIMADMRDLWEALGR